MDELTAKKQVVEAGLELVEKGLIARTWGNVSCRVGEDGFVITPSGKAYDGLSASDIVRCKTEDASYTGEIKPSSEKKVHALIYRARPDAGFVIHTHQKLASAVSVLDMAAIPGGLSPDGQPVPLAEYGLPGTKKLSANVAGALEKTGGKTLIMARHGTVCFGDCREEAFKNALALEKTAEAFIAELFGKAGGRRYSSEKDLFAYYCEKASARYPGVPQNLGSSRRDGNGFILTLGGEALAYP
ncbi:MAG: class II aldolase/adducin family protein, partial [Oscillospiraceae bacterium]|nr:class II aldolase/adducin family protein [Oscillospiraceae bacterium]